MCDNENVMIYAGSLNLTGASSMSEENTDIDQKINIEAVYKDFCAWRSNKTQRNIPDELWDKALGLLENHSMSTVSSKLGLSYPQIQNKQKQ